MSGKTKSSSPGNQDIKRFFMVRQESSLPPGTEKRSDSKQDGGTAKTEELQRQNQKKTANTSSLDKISIS